MRRGGLLVGLVVAAAVVRVSEAIAARLPTVPERKAILAAFNAYPPAAGSRANWEA